MFTAASFSVCNVERNQIVLKFTQVVVCGLGLVFSWLFGSCTDKKQFLRPVPCHLCYMNFHTGYIIPKSLFQTVVICVLLLGMPAPVSVAEASVRGVVWKQLVSIEEGMPSSSHKAVCLPRWFLQQKYIWTYTLHDVVYSNATPSRPIGLITPVHCALLSNRMKNRANRCILY